MLALMLTLMLAPQDPSVEPTRTEELQRAREQKAQQLQAPRRSFLEKGLYEFKERRMMERFQAGFAGFHPLVGGIKPGSGFALGTSYDISKQVKASAQFSAKGYQKYEVAYATPHFLTNRVFAEVRTTYRDLPEETFFGRGNNTRSEDEAIYGLKDRSVSGQIGINVRKHVKVGGQLGWVDTTISEGTKTFLPSVLDNFSASSSAGLRQHADLPAHRGHRRRRLPGRTGQPASGRPLSPPGSHPLRIWISACMTSRNTTLTSSSTSRSSISDGLSLFAPGQR